MSWEETAEHNNHEAGVGHWLVRIEYFYLRDGDNVEAMLLYLPRIETTDSHVRDKAGNRGMQLFGTQIEGEYAPISEDKLP